MLERLYRDLDVFADNSRLLHLLIRLYQQHGDTPLLTLPQLTEITRQYLHALRRRVALFPFIHNIDTSRQLIQRLESVFEVLMEWTQHATAFRHPDADTRSRVYLPDLQNLTLPQFTPQNELFFVPILVPEQRSPSLVFEESEDPLTCGICYERSRERAHCQNPHTDSVCRQCAGRLSQCPYCRSPYR